MTTTVGAMPIAPADDNVSSLARLFAPRKTRHHGAWPTDYRESSAERAVWWAINALQLAWMCGFTAFLFLPCMFTLLCTANTETAFGLGRAFWAPINIRFGFARVEVEGADKLPKPGTPYVMMLNHQSMIDILVVWLLARTGPRFVAKRALLFVPIVGFFMWVMGMVPVDRGNRRRAIEALERVQSVLDGGHVIACFPEGTRTKDGTIAPFKKGVFVAALGAAAPIVPVALDGCAILVPSKGWRPRPVVIRVKVGDAVATANRDRDDVMAEVRGQLIDLYASIGGRRAA
jgi:1-acyl-sn-glycerol-3-phosphate acyltransferase